MRISGVLLRAGIHPHDAFSESSLQGARHFSWDGEALTQAESEGASSTADAEVLLTTFVRAAGPAPWELLVRDLFQPPGFNPTASQNLAAIVFVLVSDPADPKGSRRWVGWTFGAAARSLRHACLEPRFGLFAAMNEIAKAEDGGLRQVEYRTFGAYRQRSGHTAGRDTPLDAFRVDPLMDLVSGIGGHSGTYNSSEFYGGRAIRRSADVSGVAALQQFAQAAINEYRDDTYATSEFAFVDDFAPVEGASDLQALSETLAALVVSDSDRVDAFMPDDLVAYEDPRAIQYVLLPSERTGSASRTTLTPSNLASALGGDGAVGLERRLRFLDSAHDEIAHATVLECLSADFELDGIRYVASDGDFYRVRKSFLKRIDDELSAISATELAFPNYTSGPEPEWLGKVAGIEGTEFIRIDPSTITIPGESSFEAADLIHQSGALVHVKRKGRSRALSYAMVQARRSSQMLASVPEARTKLETLVAAAPSDSKLKSKAGKGIAALASSPSLLPVAIVFLGRSPKEGLSGLPLLAKLELVETSKYIARLGYVFGVHLVGT
ncbi:MAG: DUF6119 family protein [Actinomycetota bacterium]